MEHKTSREKAWVASKSKVKEVTNKVEDSDILNFNEDNDSFEEMEEVEEKVELSEEEKQAIRKKLGILLLIVFIAFIIMIVRLFFNPFSNDKTEEKDTKEETKVEEKTLQDYKDGEIELKDELVASIIDELELNAHELYEIDSVGYFKKSSLDVSNMSDIQKLVLLSKTSEFKSLMKTYGKDSSICDSKITIKKADIDDILNKRFNTSINDYKDFSFYFYDVDKSIADVKLTYSNGVYTGNCYDAKFSVNQYVNQEFVKAEKTGNNLKIYAKTIFINKNGAYKDSNFKTLIEPKNDDSDRFENANTYVYTFMLDGNSQYLTNISLQ